MQYQRKIELEVLGISSNSSRNDAFALVLGERYGSRRLPVVIGLTEAQSVAVQLEHVPTPRPLTHDLFFSLGASFDIAVTEVQIYDLHDGIFFSKMVCERDGKVVEIDARTSDAVGIALRFEAPIYTFENILQQAAIVVSEETGNSNPASEGYDCLTDNEISNMMESAISIEDYEKASELRDLLRRRRGETV